MPNPQTANLDNCGGKHIYCLYWSNSRQELSLMFNGTSPPAVCALCLCEQSHGGFSNICVHLQYTWVRCSSHVRRWIIDDKNQWIVWRAKYHSSSSMPKLKWELEPFNLYGGGAPIMIWWVGGKKYTSRIKLYKYISFLFMHPFIYLFVRLFLLGGKQYKPHVNQSLIHSSIC